MAAPSILLPAIFISLFLSLALSETPSSCLDQSTPKSLSCEVEDVKLRIARLESILDDRIAEIDAKSQYYRGAEKRIGQLTLEIGRLKTAVSSFEHDRSRANLRLAALEDEIRLLWSDSRKNNFEIHALELKALEAESTLQEVFFRVDVTTDIVSEQWIQIQELEQAVPMAEVRTSKLKRELWKRFPFMKFFVDHIDGYLKTRKKILDPYFSRAESVFVFCKSRFLQTFEGVKRYHRQLQGFIRHLMQSNQITAALAHDEVVRFLASVLLAFAAVVACMLLLS